MLSWMNKVHRHPMPFSTRCSVLIELKNLPTNEQVADILTKTLPIAKFKYFRHYPNVCDFASREVLRFDAKY